jgi:hypothetical protein
MSELTESFASVQEALEALRVKGSDYVLVKLLSDAQDNEKNQIYLGGSSVVFQRVPGKEIQTTSSKSAKKLSKNPNFLKIAQSIDFSWVDPHGSYQAPNTKMIFYPQYPEIRLSGFLNGAKKAPKAIRRAFQGNFGKRYLMLGIAKHNVFGILVTSNQTAGCHALDSLPTWSSSKILRIKKLKIGMDSLDGARLVREIKKIASTGPHNSVTLEKHGSKPKPFSGWQGGGYTLEALLGIPRNAISAPDKYGFEIKTFNKSSITLITTEPDFGIRQSDGLKVFLNRFGWKGAKDDGSLRFNGRHYLEGKSTARSNLRLTIENWDIANNQPSGTGKPRIRLVNSKNEIAAGWSLDKLTDAWMKKHSGAIYVETSPIKSSTEKYPRAYDFKGRLYKCEGTSTVKLIKALLDGIIFLDPGDRELEGGEGKKRTQWRLAGTNKNLKALLDRLYDKVTDLTD